MTRKRWWALALLCSAYFMVILDVSIVNVALPSIQKDLHFSQGDLQWVLSAYALTFGGFLLLGGRAADLLGRRRVFMVGVALFTAASLACGLSSSEGMLIAARAVQGLGAAILSPAALSIISTTFAEGSERNKALGIWGAMGGSGAAVGVLMGGVLTKWLGWEWIFFVNIPVGVAVLLLVRSVVRESRSEHAVRQYDALGAVLITSALVLLVYALTRANVNGWGSAETLGVLAVSAVLHIAFVVVELRSKAPLVPLGIFARLRTLTGANVVAFLLGGLTFAMFFMLSLYMQQVLGMSALQAGAGYLAVALTAIVSAGVAQAMVTKIGVKPAMIIRARADDARKRLVHAGLARRLLPGRPAPRVLRDRSRARLLVRAGIDRRAGGRRRRTKPASRPGCSTPRSRSAARSASRCFSTVSTNRTQHLLAEGESRAQALTSGFSPRFLGRGRLRRRGAARDAADDPPRGARHGPAEA